MKLLIIGGTVFLGRHVVEAALARGHQVTLFNRGRSSPDLYPEVEKLRGDRDQDLSALEGRSWDSVIDTCGYLPSSVRASAHMLAGGVGHYAFVSTIGVYADFSKIGIVETDQLVELSEEQLAKGEELNNETYGPLKVLCEKAIEEELPGRALIVRAGLIVGPYDATDRFTYWVRRVARGGRVLAPGKPDRQVQLISVQDLAGWIVRMAESNGAGVFNCTGPDYRLTMGRLLAECKNTLASDAEFVWVEESFLLEKTVEPWNELPLWVPENNAAYAGFQSVDVSKAIAAGLKFSPLSETVHNTLAWDLSRTTSAAPYKVLGMSIPPGGISAEREAELIRDWEARLNNAPQAGV